MRSSVYLALAASVALIGLGTTYSIYYDTWLDTSDPTRTSLPHPLHGQHVFASKQNPLNTLYLKRLWFWTTAAFAALFQATHPRAQTYEALYQYIAETGVWLVFTSWFFGPALLERIILATGGECSVTLPSGYVVPLPVKYCLPGAPRAVSPATHPSLFAASLVVPELSWHSQPRMRRGHDISGHIFLLTMSTLFLADQIAAFRRAAPAPARTTVQKAALGGALAVVAVNLFSMYVTSVYFHSASEKLSGFRKWTLSSLR
jgi:hypothetical protein